MTIDQIMDASCCVYEVSREDLLGKKRLKMMVAARQMVMYLMRRVLKMPLKDICVALGRHHSTVVHDVQVCENKLKYYEDVREEMNWVMGLILKI
jgi:chromosomal replication initiator protein